jgi:hypothetical protein
MIVNITNSNVYNVTLLTDMTSLGSDNGINTSTIAWVDEIKAWIWPLTISATSSTWSGAGGLQSGIHSWTFTTNTTTGYAAGFYDHGATANTFSPSLNFGTVNVGRAAHFYIVTGAVPGSDVNLLVAATANGSGIDDNGTSTPGASETIVIPGATAANTYYETSTKFNGEVNISVTLGTPISCNYGWAKYHDVGNQDFCVRGIEALWESDSTDSASDIELLHHKATGWTYNASGAATTPTPIAARSTDYTPDDDQQVGPGAWKRTNLSTSVAGASNEGIIFRIMSGSLGGGSLSFRNLDLEVFLTVE